MIDTMAFLGNSGSTGTWGGGRLLVSPSTAALLFLKAAVFGLVCTAVLCTTALRENTHTVNKTTLVEQGCL